MEATLQVIMEQLRELSAGQSAISTGKEALKSDISTTTTELEWH
jgi:hypothetical protein